MSYTAKEKKSNSFLSYRLVGWIFIFIAFGIIGLTFYPVIMAEINYRFYRLPAHYIVTADKERISDTYVIAPVDADFGIVIPRINANAPIVPNVDPYNEHEYQKLLTKGVAHAKGTAFPGDDGGVFLFAHSAADFYRASQYNAVFYLIGKLESGDLIYLFYHNNRYVYEVTDKKIVDAKDVVYIVSERKQRMLTLMTCWPAGTTLKRLIVQAKLIST